MATPNLANVATIKPFTKVGAITTSDVYAFQVPAESCYKLESFYVSNVDGTNSATCEVDVSTDNQSSNYALVYNLVVPPGATIAILTTPLYLDETDSIRVSASAAGDLQWFASGTELID
jgi:hypothetical protein